MNNVETSTCSTNNVVLRTLVQKAMYITNFFMSLSECQMITRLKIYGADHLNYFLLSLSSGIIEKMASFASCSDNFDDWCTQWNIPTSVIQLCNNLGASVPSDLAELDAQRIEKFIQENQLLEIEATRFRRGYQAVIEAMVGVSFILCCFFLLIISIVSHSL